MEEEPAPTAPAVEEGNVPEPTRVGDEDAAAAAAQLATGNTEAVVDLSSSSSEYENSEDINPAAVASAFNKAVEFISNSAEVLGAGMYEELARDEGHGDVGDWAIVRSAVLSEPVPAGFRDSGDWRSYVIPSESDDAEREEEEAWENLTVWGQVEEGLSKVMDLVSKVLHTSSEVSVFVCPFSVLRVCFHLMFLHTPPHSHQLLSISREKNEKLTRL